MPLPPKGVCPAYDTSNNRQPPGRTQTLIPTGWQPFQTSPNPNPNKPIYTCKQAMDVQLSFVKLQWTWQCCNHKQTKLHVPFLIYFCHCSGDLFMFYHWFPLLIVELGWYSSCSCEIDFITAVHPRLKQILFLHFGVDSKQLLTAWWPYIRNEKKTQKDALIENHQRD